MAEFAGKFSTTELRTLTTRWGMVTVPEELYQEVQEMNRDKSKLEEMVDNYQKMLHEERDRCDALLAENEGLRGFLKEVESTTAFWNQTISELEFTVEQQKKELEEMMMKTRIFTRDREDTLKGGEWVPRGGGEYEWSVEKEPLESKDDRIFGVSSATLVLDGKEIALTSGTLTVGAGGGIIFNDKTYRTGG